MMMRRMLWRLRASQRLSTRRRFVSSIYSQHSPGKIGTGDEEVPISGEEFAKMLNSLMSLKDDARRIGIPHETLLTQQLLF